MSETKEEKSPRRREETAWLDDSQSERLVAAIGLAERGTRGEVRVHVERSCKRDAIARATQLFGELGMHQTRDGTAVLLYLAVETRNVAVYAGQGIHGAAADGFWQGVTDEVATGFKTGDGLGGLERAIERIGRLLREHAPGDDDAGNELPDTVTTA